MPLTCKSSQVKLIDFFFFFFGPRSQKLISFIVCPNCSNALTISHGDPSTRYPLGINRFECRTCPYEYIVDQAYYELTPMKQKEVEGVFGGKDEFKNADTMEGM